MRNQWNKKEDVESLEKVRMGKSFGEAVNSNRSQRLV